MTRHGQANSGAKDHESYDQLSALGHQQARWLGDYFSEIDQSFDRIIAGDLKRQQETARGLNIPNLPIETDRRLNELDYFGLAQDLEEKFAVPFPDTQEKFVEQICTILTYWEQGKITSHMESYAAFHNRIEEIIDEFAKRDERVLMVSSTGVIASIVAQQLSVPIAHRNRLFVSIMHTSLNRFELSCGMLLPTLFCATPHLDRPERHHARTFI